LEIDADKLFATFEQLRMSRKVGFVFRETLALHEFAREVLCPFIATSYRPPYKEFDSAVLLLLARVALWTDTLAALDNAVHFQAVASGQRCLFELLIDLKVLVARPDFAPKFHEFIFVERYWATRQIVEAADGDVDALARIPEDVAFVTDPANATRFEDSRKLLWGKEGPKNRVLHWAGKLSRAIELTQDSEIRRRHTEKYPYACFLVHGAAVGTAGLPENGFYSWFPWSHLDIQWLLFEFFSESLKALGFDVAYPDLRKKLLATKATMAAAILSEQRAISEGEG
jgi:hypothetical protein